MRHRDRVPDWQGWTQGPRTDGKCPWLGFRWKQVDLCCSGAMPLCPTALSLFWTLWRRTHKKTSNCNYSWCHLHSTSDELWPPELLPEQQRQPVQQLGLRAAVLRVFTVATADVTESYWFVTDLGCLKANLHLKFQQHSSAWHLEQGWTWF